MLLESTVTLSAVAATFYVGYHLQDQANEKRRQHAQIMAYDQIESINKSLKVHLTPDMQRALQEQYTDFYYKQLNEAAVNLTAAKNYGFDPES